MQKSVLITGCSSGIGLAAAKALHQRGYCVLAACRKSADLAHMRELGFEPIELDLDDEESVERAAKQVLEVTGSRLFGLFNNGGFAVYGSLESISRAQMEKQFSTNFFWYSSTYLPAITRHTRLWSWTHCPNQFCYGINFYTKPRGIRSQ